MATALTSDAPPDSGRDRIMDEAATLFLHQGYDATSLRHIADVVGMKAGSIYYHFTSKEELLTKILQRGISVMVAAFDQAQRTTDGQAPAIALEAHVRAHLAALFENGPYTAAHVMTFRTAPDAVRNEIVPVRDAYEARWTEMFRQLQADGEIPPTVDVRVARLILFGAMNSSVDWFDPSRGKLDRFATAITHQFWNGVAA